MRLVVHLRRCGPARGRASRAPPARGRASRRRGHIPESGGGGEARDLSGVVPRVAGMLSRAAPSENSAFRFHALAVPQRGTRAKRARPPTGSSQPRRSISTAPAASDGPSTPKPRASARSRRHFGGAPQGPGGALSAAAGPRRVDVPVADEGLERSAPPVRTPGEAPKAYGAQRKPWGASLPRRAFRCDLETTFEAGPRDVAASNSGTPHRETIAYIRGLDGMAARRAAGPARGCAAAARPKRANFVVSGPPCAAIRAKRCV